MLEYGENPGQRFGQNVGDAERWVSIVAGLGLTLAAIRGGGLIRRVTTAAAGLSLLTRGMTGYCGMKAALAGQTSLRDGIIEQVSRSRFGFTPARRIDSLESLYVAELQELRSAEEQLIRLIEDMAGKLENQHLERRLHGYAVELRSRCQDLDRILQSRGVNPRRHPDQAMHALAYETRKMAQVCGAHVRDAALVASLQRLIHYKIAGYGNVAAYAKALDRPEEAARFAEDADREKAMDAELTQIAKSVLNPQARDEAREQRPEVRAHYNS